MKFSQWLKTQRKNNLLSQQDLAEEIGVDRATINYLENGHRNPTLATARKLAIYFKADPREVLEILKGKE